MVSKEREEGNYVAARFLATMEGVLVQDIACVEHPLLAKRYMARREELTCKGHGMELHLWHGTGNASPETILNSETGLDPLYGRETGCFYGRAVYVAEFA